jgi:hypothetical protein
MLSLASRTIAVSARLVISLKPMKQNRRRPPIPRHEFGFVPDTFALVHSGAHSARESAGAARRIEGSALFAGESQFREFQLAAAAPLGELAVFEIKLEGRLSFLVGVFPQL